jgi:hypothetical protein
MLLVTDDPATGPEALIPEARELQRQRSRRRMFFFALAGVLLAVVFGIYQLVQGGSTVSATPPASAGANAKPTVTYEKVVIQKIVPHLPVETTTIETWSAPDGITNREIVTNAGGAPIEIGAAPGTDKALGALQVNYLYDKTTGRIYRTGYTTASTKKLPTPEQMFKNALARPYFHLAGTTTYRGQKVYIVALRDEDRGVHGTIYVDERTFEPMLQTESSVDLRTVVRTLAFKTLPATTANLALTSLSGLHPKARIVLQAPPRIKQLYGDAAFPSGDRA